MRMIGHIRRDLARVTAVMVASTMPLLSGCVLTSDDIRAAAAQSLASFASGLGGNVLLDWFNMAFGVA